MHFLVWQVLLSRLALETRAAKRVGRHLRKVTDADWASDKISWRSVNLGVGVLNCWAKKKKSVALSSLESELFEAILSGTRLLGIQSELMDLEYNCSVTVATDSENAIDHSRRCCV